MKNILGIFFIILGLNACQSKSPTLETHHHSIHGLWQLQIMEIKDSLNHWQEWRDGMQGYLLYDNHNHVALHLFSKGYENFEPHFPNFTDTIPLVALHHLTNNYNYIGTYILDEAQQIIRHTRLSHSNPRDWGQMVERKYHFSGDTLIMQPIESKHANLKLKWLIVK